jgi:drug/metabolite transporter (DMT)-like permease
MKTRDLVYLLVLSALWGASYLFMRIAAPEFGPVVLIHLRVAAASLLLLPIFLLRSDISELKSNWKRLAIVGTLNSVLPFCLLAYSTLYLSGGFASILTATSPLFAALIAWVWLSDRLDASRITGLVIGFAGVVVLVRDKVSFDVNGVSLAILAAIVASAFYGIGANYIKKKLSGIRSLALATGSQVAATMVLLPFAVMLWPSGPISARAWVSVILLGTASTAVAYLLYFRLITNVGPVRALTVTYLIPAFAVLWGAVFIDERVTIVMVVGCLIILFGTALATGLVSLYGKPVRNWRRRK